MDVQLPNPGLEQSDSVSELSSLPVTPSASLQTPTTPSDHYFPRTFSTLSSASSKRRSIVRRSITVLEGLPKEFASLIRSHSTSRRYSSQLQGHGQSNRESRPVHDNTPMNDIQLRPSLDMKLPCSHADDERPTRMTKFENKIYSFLTRSRSRSRSKQDTEDSPKASTSKSRERMHQENGEHGKKPALPPKSKETNGTKPISRIPSRPISSTTTATNSTVTPTTPKARRRPPSELPLPATPAQPQSHEKERPSSRPTTPKPPAAKKKLFSIPLSLRRSSRSRSRSRPNTPQQSSIDLPPLPHATDENDPTPKPRKSYSTSAPAPRPPSPTPIAKPKAPGPIKPSISGGSTSTSLKLPKFFAGRTTTSAISSPRHPSAVTAPNGSADPKSSTSSAVVSSPLKSSSYRRSLKPDGKSSEHPTPSVTGPLRPSAMVPNGKAPISSQNPPPLPSKVPSKITSSTPSAPSSKPASPETKLQPPSKTRQTHHVAKNLSLDASYRYRGGNMSSVDEEGRLGPEMPHLATSSSLKGKSRETDSFSQLRASTTTTAKMSPAVRSARHGSFDFERPGWGATMIQRTGSNGTTVPAGSNHSGPTSKDRYHGGEKERDSGSGPGLAGVGTLQKEKSLKRLKDVEEEIKARERAKRLEEYIQKDKLPSVGHHGSTSNHSDHVHASTSTNGTAHTNKSSSWGKATGKRTLAGSRAAGGGVPRLIGTAQHGLFHFESPVPSPTRSSGASTATATETRHHHGHGGRSDRSSDQSTKDEKTSKTTRDGEKSSKVGGMKGDRPPVPVPLPPVSSIPQRAGGRGRSLDLGLGLAWAPSRMKEAALLPSSMLFNRSASNTSSLGRSTSGSTMARSASSSTNGHESSRSRRIHIQDSDPEAERSKLGKEVADLFRSVLDDRGYNAFKSYVRQFDAHEIPFDGPSGIVERVERLLKNAPNVGQDNRAILDKFVRIILQNA